MDKAWFEMRAIRQRKLNTAVWIPLRAVDKTGQLGRFGFHGFKEDFFGAGTLAVPVAAREAANQLGWGDIGISHHHGPCVQEGSYLASDAYDSHLENFRGIHLALEQWTNRIEKVEWHLHQDLV